MSGDHCNVRKSFIRQRGHGENRMLIGIIGRVQK